MRCVKSLSVCLLAFALLFSLGSEVGALYSYKVGNLTKTTDRNLTVHVIAHTHNDPGWLKTVDEYYFGLNNSIYWAGVQYILDSAVEELDYYPYRKFIYVEMAFFTRWWNEQEKSTKALVKSLLKDGRLEFIGGGWVMHDEASPYYEDKIDNMAVGHQFLKDTFNFTPTIGWQIDPFGHSSTTASLFAKMGFDGLWFSRIDMQDKVKRLAEKSMELIWQPMTSQNEENQIFTAVNYAHYSAPAGFCFDIIQCADDPIAYDPDLEYYNVEQKVQQITSYFRNMSASYQSDHLLHTWGDDFNFQAAASYFKNLDNLIKATNARFDQYGIKMIYSTPSRYLKSINQQNLTFPLKTDDFFPYSDAPDAFWTGYFTSRVSQKGYTRDSGRLFQNIRRLVSQKLLQQDSQYLKTNVAAVVKALGAAEQNRGLLQHHDAVTGTARQRVKEDYLYLMQKQMNNLHKVVTNPIFIEATKQKLGVNSNYTSCLLNTTAEACQVTQRLLNKQKVLVAIYNPLKNSRHQIIRLKVPTTKVQVYSLKSKNAKIKLDTDVICANKTSASDCDLFFLDNFEGFSMSHYLLLPTTHSNEAESIDAINSLSPSETIPLSDNRSVTIYRDLSTVVINEGLDSHPFRFKVNYYPGYGTDTGQNSGAYIFRPQNYSINYSKPYADINSHKIFRGKVVTQATFYADEAIVVMRFENKQSSIPGFELETFVNSINVEDNIGKEVVIIIEALKINNNKEWYTDANGLEMQKRRFNYRPTWNFTTGQYSSGNYYPITSAIYIQDSTTGLRATLLTDRAHGATSLKNGQIELMLHRRLLFDDARGVAEALNESDWDGKGLRQWFSHRLVFSKGSDAQRTAQFHLDQPNIVLLSPYQQSCFELIISQIQPVLGVFKSNTFRAESALEPVQRESLPKNVKIVYKPYKASEHVIWLHNLNEKDVKVSVASLKAHPYQSVTLEELSLSANQPKAEMLKKKLLWNGAKGASIESVYNNSQKEIHLRGLEIRCFLYKVSKQ